MNETALRPAPYLAFDHRMAFEIALGLDPLAEIVARYDLTPEQFARIAALPAFKQQIIAYRTEIKERGLSFKEKAKVMAEDLLGKTYDLIHHPGTSAAVKADLIKWVSKMAGHETPAQVEGGAYLPQIAAALKGLADGDLELRVTEIVKRRAPEKEVEGAVLDATPHLH